MSSKRRKSSLTKTETRGELEFCVFIFLGRAECLGPFFRILTSYKRVNRITDQIFSTRKDSMRARSTTRRRLDTRRAARRSTATTNPQNVSPRIPFLSFYILYTHSFFISATLNILIISLLFFCLVVQNII